MEKIKRFKEPIYITRPLLPPLNEVFGKIQEIWESKWLTNMGSQHKMLESELIKTLRVKYLTLFCNGTQALELACQALKITGRVITTPFTFPATVNALYQNNLNPIYCDISLDDFNIKSDAIEELITPETSAIMPVHVFGNPCNVEEIQRIADKYNLKVIYDAAHCFGIEYKNKGIGNYGDVSMFSFHATKVFHTIEGGALTYNDFNLKEQLNLLKNFGIKNKEEIILPGTNAKMNELQAAIGLLNLKYFEEEIEKRKNISIIYKENLKDVEGITYLEEKENLKYNYQYFPILINEKNFNLSRDKLYEQLIEYNVISRKYFYPLCTEYKYQNSTENYQIPNAKKIAKEILCLPIYGELKKDDIEKICKIIIYLQKSHS